MNRLDALFNRHKVVRRLALAWACWLVSVVVLRVTAPDVVVKIGTAGATIVVAVIGLVGTVAALYQRSRQSDDSREGP